jgi:hypothetical protein
MVAVTYVRDIGASRASYELLGFREDSSEVAHMGHPPHALGGEVKVLDPDGNTVLLGQRERSASQPPAADDGTAPRFSLLKEAAALVEARGGTTVMCQIGDGRGRDVRRGRGHPAGRRHRCQCRRRGEPAAVKPA